MVQDLPEGTITIMFTDLVGSTALGDRLGEDAAQALRRAHDRILRQQFARFDGRVIKGTGDGFMAAFASARRGVECAVELQRAIAAQHAEGRYLELEVRAGVHTGEPVAEGGDLFGSDVNLAARIASEAAGGHVLVSEVTRLLVRGSLGFQFTALGERSIKGFVERVPLFDVRWPQEAVSPRLTRFVGRQPESAQLRRHLEAAIRGQGRLVMVAGEPGVGKTRLVSELAIDATDHGLPVLSGHAYETEGMPPYLPIIEALTQYLRCHGIEDLREDLGEGAPYVSKLLPELGRLLPDISESPPLSPEAERHRLFDAVSDFLLTAARRKPLLLFLDDLHWADAATLLLLQHLSRRVSEAPLLVVGTYRDTEVDARHPLRGLMTETARQGLSYTMALRPFDRNEAAMLMEAVLGSTAADHVVDALFSAAEGNPFFTEELVRHLREQGHDLANPKAGVGEWPIPETVRQVIVRRLARLREEANRVLTYSSVLGRDLSLPKVAAVTGRDEDTLLDLLDEAVAAHVLREGVEGYAFSHPLIQETLYQGLTAPRRRQLHGRVSKALEALWGADLDLQRLAELAHHFFAGAGQGDVAKATSYATRAAESALSQLAYEEAVRLYQMALDALDLAETRGNQAAQRCELLLSLGEAHDKAGDRAKASETFQQAAALARELGHAEGLARAALGLAWHWFTFTTISEVEISLQQEAVSALGDQDSALRARLMSRLAAALNVTASRERALSLSQDAEAVARRVGDKAALAFTLLSKHYVWGPASAEDRLAVVTEILRLAEEVGDREMVSWTHVLRHSHLLELGDIPGADEEMEVVARQAEELQQPYYLWRAAISRTSRALLEGQLEEGEQLAREALNFGQRAQAPGTAMVFAAQMFAVRREQGRLEELEPIFRAFVQQYPKMPASRCTLADLYRELGRETDARREFEHLAANDFADLPQDEVWLTGVTLLSEVCSFLGDARRADPLYQILLPYSRRNVVVSVGVACHGSASRYLGLLAATMQRWQDAERHFEDALGMNTHMGARPWVAHTEHDYACMLLARRQPGDRKKAYSLLSRAVDTARDLGMTRLTEQVMALFKSHGGVMPVYPTV